MINNKRYYTLAGPVFGEHVSAEVTDSRIESAGVQPGWAQDGTYVMHVYPYGKVINSSIKGNMYIEGLSNGGETNCVSYPGVRSGIAGPGQLINPGQMFGRARILNGTVNFTLNNQYYFNGEVTPWPSN